MKLLGDPRFAFGRLATGFRPPGLSGTFVVKATLRLKPGAPAELLDKPELVTGDLHYDDDPEKSLRYSVDLVPWKPKTDLLLVGSCHVPGGKAAEACAVTFGLGKWSKRLVATAKSPFTRMALSDAEVVYRDRLTVRCPTAFEPISPTAPERMKKVGTFDKKWLQKRWPWYPEDFDFGYFNAAPPDQQFDAYLRGDESIVLENLHPEHGVLRSSLPGFRMRLFLDEEDDRFREVPMVLDTLWIDSDSATLVLVWRGHVPIPHIKFKGLRNVYWAAEPLSSPPAPVEKHHEDVKRLSNPPKPAPPPPKEEPPPDRSFEEQIAKAEEEFKKLEALAEKRKAALMEDLKSRGIKLPPPTTDPAKMFEEAGAAVAQAIAEIRKVSPDAAAKLAAVPFPKLEDFALEEVPKPAPEEPKWTRERVLDAAARGVDLSGRNLSGLDLSGAKLAGARLVRTRLSRANLAGANLVGANLDGADFAGANLTGAVLREASLTKADFSKSVIEAADFSASSGRRAMFSEAKGKGARFVSARLPNSDFSRAEIENADFTGAELPAVDFERAKASGVRMEDADLTGLRAGKAVDFAKGRFDRARGAGSTWEGGKLDGATFAGAALSRADFSETSMTEVNLEGADLASAIFADASLRGSSLRRVHAAHACFERTDLEGADLRGANFYAAEFWDARTGAALLDDANLEGTKLAT